MNNTDAFSSSHENVQDYTSVKEVFKTEVVCVCGETIHIEEERRLSWKAVRNLLNKIKSKL